MARRFKDPSETIEIMQDNLPALYFVFGRMKSEEMAFELGKQWDFLDPDEKQKVRKFIFQAEKEHEDIFLHRDRAILKKLLMQGIGYHHAGISPALKKLVEKLYEARLIWVLFCTETFAAGVNFPAATAIFESTRKWDGREFRQLLNREFFQMAGRAGRRGFDQEGYVYIQMNSNFPDETGFFKESEVEMVHGRLTVSANTVLSLLMWKDDTEIEHFLKSNFSAYQKRRQLKEIKQQITDLKKQMNQFEDSFCDQKNSDVCPLKSKNLKKELRKLKSRKFRELPGTQKNINEIQKKLKAMQKKKCKKDLCLDASKIISETNSKLGILLYQKKQLIYEAERYTTEFHKMRKLLEKTGYLNGRELLPRGKFALHLHIQEIFVTELVFSGMLEELPSDVVAGVLAGVDYVPGRREYVQPAPFDIDPINKLRAELMAYGVSEQYMTWSPVPAYIAYAWYNGKDFTHLMESSSLQEGDLVSVIRREIDLLRQLEKASEDNIALQEKLHGIRRTLDRDQVAVLF